MKNEVEALFHELADLSCEEREVYYRDHRIGDELRAEVEQLLNFDGGNTLTAQVSSFAQQILQTPPAASADRCGPYRLLQLIGTGGMGAVYLAERVDGEVEHRVAIKFLRYGNEEPVFLDRFLRERQILASLIHPGIARLLDAGRTTESRPYLVMEYIDGKPIDSYAESLELEDKLTLFLRVCDAVAYAHSNLIIHRDIKPSNIMVDSSGQPKLLDFGIAKVLEAPADETRTRDRLLTPEYASPEQVRGQHQTTATDIYSLGAVLYKLLTGVSPHSSDNKTQEEIMVAIGAEEPPPATRVNSDLPRDLDFILAMALRKEPAERYSSVEALASDIRAFLQWRPVRARSGNVWYRTRRFTRRYWAPITATMVAFLSLGAGLTIALHQRNLSEKRFRTVRQIAGELFNVEKDITDLNGSTPARERIVKTTLQYLENLSRDAGNDLSLKAEVAAGYRRVAEIQGVYGRPNLGHPDEARVSLERAENAFRQLCKAQPADRQALRDLIETVELESRIDYYKRDLKQLGGRVAELKSLLASYEARAAGGASEWRFLGTICDSLSSSEVQLGEPKQAAEFSRCSIDYRSKWVRAESKSVNARGSLSNSFGTYSSLCLDQGKLEDAIDAMKQSLALLEQIRAERPNHYTTRANIANHLADLGAYYGGVDDPSLGRTDLAIEYFERAGRLGREIMLSNPTENTVRLNQAIADRLFGDIIRAENPVRALAAYDEAIQLLRATTAKNYIRDVPLVRVLAESTFPLRRLKHEKEAAQRLQEARQLAAPYRSKPSDASLECFEALSRAEADWALSSGRPLEAIAIHRSFLAEAEAGTGISDAATYFTIAYRMTRRYRLLAQAAKAAGLESDARQAECKRSEIVEAWKKNVPGRPSVQAALER
jgi:serine/threonine protein kinase